MGLYDRYILPPLIDLACGTKAMMRERSKIIERARGAVLEAGRRAGQRWGSWRRLQWGDRGATWSARAGVLAVTLGAASSA